MKKEKTYPFEKSKPTNPKDFMGSLKIPFHLWPETATIFGSLALLDGALKYGRTNWRPGGVRASIYYDATRRHMNAWFEGESNDSDSGLPHLAHALACIAILIDSSVCGKLTDDRMYSDGEYIKMVKNFTPHVKRLKELYSDRSPHHFNINDRTKGKR